MSETQNVTKSSKPKAPPIKLINVVNKIRGGVGKVYQKMVPPQIAMFELISSMWTVQSIYVAAELGVADVIKDGEVHFSDIAKEVGAHPQSLYRLLRGLTCSDIFAETKEGYFKLTPMGQCLRTESPNSVRSMAIFQGHYQWTHWSKLMDAVKTGEPVVEDIRGMPLFDFLQKTPHAQKHFDRFMTTVSKMEMVSVVSAFDFSTFKSIADVGGGHGSFLASILESSPKTNGILFDQSQVVAGAEKALVSGHLKNRCEITSGDFFTDVPKAENYIMKHIIHDWEESKCVKILKNIRRHIPAHGKLLLVETVVTPPGEAHFSKMLDLEMLVNAGGLERTALQYSELFAKCGFKLNRVIPTASLASIIEAVPV